MNFTAAEQETPCLHDVTDVTGGNYTAIERCRHCGATRDGYGYSEWKPKAAAAEQETP